MSEEKERVLRIPSDVFQAFLMDEIAFKLGNVISGINELRDSTIQLLRRLQERLEDNTREIEEGIGRLEALFKETIPKGVVESLTLTVNDKIQQVKPESPWVSFSIYNRPDSESNIYVAVNRRGADRRKVEPGHLYEVDMKVPKITAIYLVAESGGSATVDITAVR